MIYSNLRFRDVELKDLTEFMEKLKNRFHRISLLIFLCKYLEIDGFLFLRSCRLSQIERESLEYFLTKNKEYMSKNASDVSAIEKYDRVKNEELVETGVEIMRRLNLG